MLSAEQMTISVLAAAAQRAHVMDVKTYEGRVTLAEFIAGFMNYYPGWIKMLYRVRWLFVRLFGMTQKGLPTVAKMRPQDVPMQPGMRAAFFKVVAAEPEHFWLVCADEPHLAAYLGIVAQPLKDGTRRFSVITLVDYHRWTGRVYFAVIRPFHHLVVNRMAQAGLTYAAQP